MFCHPRKYKPNCLRSEMTARFSKMTEITTMASKLPFPRLELHWRKTTRAEKKESGSNWVCVYRLLIHPKTACDARTNTDKGYNKVDVSVDLGYTYTDFGPD